ncbi:ribonuclease P protein component [Schaalia sp. ZJ1691]|uniref:ribonuclease P protein component n=1 Tax=Schaalia sp. ZJ1691 TaxID=2709404 RepID=UPI001F14A211|nr:ribonuclease P protein component [Schaalia sp. ZJ1691]
MVDPEDFRQTFRQGKRVGNPLIVVHCRTDEESDSRLVGFVVPKREIQRATGRNRVKRQFRHLMRSRIDDLPRGARVVIRVSGEVLGKSSEELGRTLDGTLERAWARWERR